MDVDARVEALEEERDRLLGRIDQLEEALGVTFLAPLGWGLTPAQSAVLGVLLTRELATKNAVMAALYRDLGRDEPEPKIVDVFVCHLRKKLGRVGLKIETVWGQGYALTAATKAAIRAELEAQAA